ncbi:MAG: hypothetical protein R6V04_05880 [bacterium]
MIKLCLKILIWMLSIYLFFIPFSCKIDHGLEPINSKITGSITFYGDVPPHTDEVRVAVVKNFPPKNIKSLLFSNMINFRNKTAEYELYLPRGTYEVVAVLWKEHNHSWNISNVIGVYGGSVIGDLLIPTYIPITIADNNTIVKNIDIAATLERVNRDAQIKGTINFKGDWPDNTGVMAVGAFTEIPDQGNYIDYFFKSMFIDYSIPIFVSSTDYTLRVQGGETVKYIAALWIDDSFNLTSITDVGFYPDPEGSSGTVPGSVTVPLNSVRTGINIMVDFSKTALEGSE